MPDRRKRVHVACIQSEGFGGGTGLSPEIISAKGAHVMLAAGLRPKAVKMFEGYVIEVFIGATGTVRDAIADWKEGYLEEATDENACREHRH